ncbi:PTS system [Vibrio ishigakensis]|uniref:PTS system n=1 Tax=Vibrio ishigakensis TaxID=1481914 RepID=A0A0B8P233_9VIBR|nr:PTS system [Vibrio ishigakensis]
MVDSITPTVTKNFLKPMLIVLIAAPIGILLVGPMGIWIGTAISTLVYTIHGTLGWLAVAIMGALWPLLVLTGMHRVFTPTIIQTIAETGTEGMVMPSEIGANIGMGGACLAVAWKTRNIALKQTSMAAGASANGGYLRASTIRRIGSLEASTHRDPNHRLYCRWSSRLCSIASHSMAAPSLFTSVQFIDVNDPMSLVWVLGLMALSVVLSFVLTLMLGFDDIPNEEEDDMNKSQKKEADKKEEPKLTEAPVAAKATA